MTKENEIYSNMGPQTHAYADVKEMAKISEITEELIKEQVEDIQNRELVNLLLAILMQYNGEISIEQGYMARAMVRRQQTPEGPFPKIDITKDAEGKLTLSLVTKEDFDEQYKEVCHQHWFTHEPAGGYSIQYKHKQTGERKAELWKHKSDYDIGKEPDKVIREGSMIGPGEFEKRVREWYGLED